MIAIMSDALVETLLGLSTRRRQVTARETLFRAGDAVRSLFIVEQGALRLVRPLPQGGEVTLQRARARQLLAEASIFATRYHCDAVAEEDCVLRAVPLRRLHPSLRADHDLGTALMRHLSRELQSARAQSELLALRTIEARLDAWLALNGGALPARGQWHTLATCLGVSPEALYRELARRRARQPRGHAAT